MKPGNSPWLTLHDNPGHDGRVGNAKDGSAPVVADAGVAALAIATGPTPAIAHVTPAMAVKRLSENSMSFSLCREVGATVETLRRTHLVRRTPPLCSLKRNWLSKLNDGAAA
jgi:hypothetical protein